jgi:hypothetical protein
MNQRPTEIMRSLMALILADHDVQSAAQTTWGKSLQGYIGIDDDKQPEAANMPLLAMRPGSYVPANDRSHRMVTIACALVVNLDGTTGTNPVEMDGLSAIELLYQRVETVIETWADDTYHYQVAWGDSFTEISFPVYRITWTLTAQENY